MNTYASPSYTKASRTRRESPGWAAFDLKHRHNQGLQPQVSNDHYPPMPTTLTPLHAGGNLPRNNGFSARSFSSVLVPSVNSPTLTENIHCNKSTQAGNCGGNKIMDKKSHDFTFKKLKEIHGWAESSLIEDIMAAVDDDIDKASTLLQSMVSATYPEDSKDTEPSSTCDDYSPCDKRTDKNVSLEKTTGLAAEIVADITDLSSTLEDALKDNHKELRDVHASCAPRISDDAAANMKMILGHLRSIPLEPEWEEDDVYLSRRKSALRKMRSASHHSRAATNAYLRGDHISAKQHSLKAREEWLAAERLNTKAAKDILSIRNSKNDRWTLDLHGLHALEAVQALQEHLQKIETQIPLNRPMFPNRALTKSGLMPYSLLESFSSMNVENLDKQQTPIRQRPAALQVITGVGNHSRGPAALPTVVKSFLNENRYCFDEARLGVITVQPKFHQSTN